MHEGAFDLCSIRCVHPSRRGSANCWLNSWPSVPSAFSRLSSARGKHCHRERPHCGEALHAQCDRPDRHLQVKGTRPPRRGFTRFGMPTHSLDSARGAGCPLPTRNRWPKTDVAIEASSRQVTSLPHTRSARRLPQLGYELLSRPCFREVIENLAQKLARPSPPLRRRWGASSGLRQKPRLRTYRSYGLAALNLWPEQIRKLVC